MSISCWRVVTGHLDIVEQYDVMMMSPWHVGATIRFTVPSQKGG